MADFWFSVVWAGLVTLATLLADWVAGLITLYARGFKAIERTVDQATSDRDGMVKVKEHLQRLAARKRAGLAWGGDLVAVALALDIAALGIWTSRGELFPFFTRFNTADTSREIQIWLALIIAHFVLLMLSLVLKHLHGGLIESVPSAELAGILHRGWVKQNRWMFCCNSLGFITVLSSFIILTNAI